MASLRNAINDKCKECVYDPLLPGTWRAQVSNCACLDCPLYSVRPVPLQNQGKSPLKIKVPIRTNPKPLGKVLVLKKSGKLVGYFDKAPKCGVAS